MNPVSSPMSSPGDGIASSAGSGRGELLRLESVTKQLGSHVAVQDVSMTVDRGEVVGIIGPSGAGKSTLLRCVNFLTPPDSGKVYFDGTQVCARYKPGRPPPAAELAQLRCKVGMVFQHFELFPHLTVRRNITLAQELVLGRGSDESKARAEELLDLVGLSDKMNSYPSQCSGGQQQRVAIARALALDPQMMLFDEPTSALDPELGADVLNVMRRLADDGMTMMVVTHEMGFAEKVTDRIVVMADGVVIENGPTEQVLKQPGHARTQQFLAAVLGR